MKYSNVTEGIFISRPNRFIANVLIDGKTEVCHVKNTGRCKELLVPGVKVFLEKSDKAERKTKYDLICVQKGDILINIDSQAPNKVVYEWIQQGDFFKNVTIIKPETTYKNSRFDCYVEADGEKIYVEVKGVTLEDNGVLMFPDAPTIRGVKHINELVDAVKNGYRGCIIFVAQMEMWEYFTPNRKMHPEFADALVLAEKTGVEIICVNCKVLPYELKIDKLIKTIIKE